MDTRPTSTLPSDSIPRTSFDNTCFLLLHVLLLPISSIVTRVAIAHKLWSSHSIVTLCYACYTSLAAILHLLLLPPAMVTRYWPLPNSYSRLFRLTCMQVKNNNGGPCAPSIAWATDRYTIGQTGTGWSWVCAALVHLQYFH